MNDSLYDVSIMYIWPSTCEIKKSALTFHPLCHFTSRYNWESSVNNTQCWYISMICDESGASVPRWRRMRESFNELIKELSRCSLTCAVAPNCLTCRFRFQWWSWMSPERAPAKLRNASAAPAWFQAELQWSGAEMALCLHNPQDSVSFTSLNN